MVSVPLRDIRRGGEGGVTLPICISSHLMLMMMTIIWVILVNMEISVILGHEITKIRNMIDYGKIDVFSVRTNIYIKNKKMGHLI